MKTLRLVQLSTILMNAGAAIWLYVDALINSTLTGFRILAIGVNVFAVCIQWWVYQLPRTHK